MVKDYIKILTTQVTCQPTNKKHTTQLSNLLHLSTCNSALVGSKNSVAIPTIPQCRQRAFPLCDQKFRDPNHPAIMRFLFGSGLSSLRPKHPAIASNSDPNHPAIASNPGIRRFCEERGSLGIKYRRAGAGPFIPVAPRLPGGAGAPSWSLCCRL